MAFTRVKTVDPTKGNAEYMFIQDAIDEFPNNPDVRFTVLVYSGTYAENVTLGDQKENIDIVGVDRDGVVIAPSSGDGITCNEKNSIRNLTVKPTGEQAKGIVLGDNCEVSNVTVEAMGTDKFGIVADAKSVIRIDDCKVKGGSSGLALTHQCADLVARGCDFVGGERGVFTDRGDRLLFQECRIAAGEEVDPGGFAQAVFVESLQATPAGDITFQSCRIEAIGGASSTGAQGVALDPEGNVRLLDCEVIAGCNNESEGEARGVRASNNAGLHIIGGSIITWAKAGKETEVWDLLSLSANGWPAMSGTRCSKWKGPIKSAERPRPIIQRIVDVSPADDDAVLADTALEEQEKDVPIMAARPDVYRTLSVKGNQAGMDQDVYIKGTDWAENEIREKITLSGTAVVAGVKPFKTATLITLPAKTADGQMVRVGWTNRLGLYHPISATGDVIEQNRKTDQDDWYKDDQVGTVNAVYATVEPNSIAENDRFEWMILTSS